MTQANNQQSVSVEAVKKNITQQVLAKVDVFTKSGELRLPKDYSPENALKSAYIILSSPDRKTGKNLLERCNQISVANSLLKMVVWGLSPLKKQCDFVPYGDQLECVPEYTGNIAMAKRYGGLKDISANVIYKGDEFVFSVDAETGRKHLVKHEQRLESLGTEIVGAYAICTMQDSTNKLEVMNMAQIRASWEQGATKGASPAHQKFPDQMAIKTVINRACKLILRASDDSIFSDDDNEPDERIIEVQAEQEIASQDVADFEQTSPVNDANAFDNVDEETGEITTTDEATQTNKLEF